ncbi:helix-turn-helix transcriptional regulator [Paenibacillus jilunlii]|uniref:DNA-binding protein n=1 Tax=Paenibacillus jilunlii TaxID=682956 RepID=A0A1G9IZL3_9BACL|nr:YafY family protein [Paenibacillus jilunlii]KWX78507.1 DNA-binding protein [Paenibacillus jilunlii]SDL30476.1 Predicted DNA-binding transcriptional regulator YafY, contains an HTH and WYL domains [Paenibacillus jilunlii]
MSKSKRLLDLMMTVNRKRKFTVKELAEEFGVSSRTILRDLQELGELGVPLYSEVGPHGGYQVLNERILPPIAFTEEEAVAIFFASHALRHYKYLPFKEESVAALQKFYHYMSGDVRDRIDEMKHRIDFVTPARQAEFPYLAILLEAATGQKVLQIDYETKGKRMERAIQPIGIYASSGLWYCPAYCFLRGGIRVFRCDRMHAVKVDTAGLAPLDLRHVHLGNREAYSHFQQGAEQEERKEPGQEADERPGRVPTNGKEQSRLHIELTQEGVQACEAELWSASLLHIREDGTGWLGGQVPRNDLRFFARFVIGLCNEAEVQEPPELAGRVRELLAGMLARYK